jgi:hypothetical protein
MKYRAKHAHLKINHPSDYKLCGYLVCEIRCLRMVQLASSTAALA